MAPEVLRGQPYDFSADWWGLGVLLFELLTGHVSGTCFIRNAHITIYEVMFTGFYSLHVYKGVDRELFLC